MELVYGPGLLVKVDARRTKLAPKVLLSDYKSMLRGVFIGQTARLE